MDSTGIRSAEIDALYDWEENLVVPDAGNHLGLKQTYRCNHLCELLEVSDAEVLMRYGKGHAYYVAADTEYSFYHDFYEKVVKEAGVIAPIEFVPKGISINTRESENTEYLFIQNFGKKAVAVPVRDGYKVIYGEKNEIVEPLKTRILKREK